MHRRGMDAQQAAKRLDEVGGDLRRAIADPKAME
jgi:hypothetical protein